MVRSSLRNVVGSGVQNIDESGSKNIGGSVFKIWSDLDPDFVLTLRFRIPLRYCSIHRL